MLWTVSIGTGTAWNYSEATHADDEQEALDNVVDAMEKRGDTGFFATAGDMKERGEDEYIIAGNHCLPLLHYGTLIIEKLDN